jgi:RNA-binding protein YlmH
MDNHLIDRLQDLAMQSTRQDCLTHTTFLTPAEQAEAIAWLRKNKNQFVLTGGYEEAERKVCFMLPSYLAGGGLPDEELNQTLSAVNLQVSSFGRQVNHRDYLGSLLALGIRRDQIGDILVQEHAAVVVVMNGIVPLIQRELTRIGSLSVKVLTMKLQDMVASDRPVESRRITAASLRLDKIAASGFGLSRTAMADLIRAGAVRVNWQEELRPDRDVPIGAVISLRGYGRIRLAEEQGRSRKDRHILIIERFL